MAQLKEHIYRSNFGIEKIEHLRGNIGYVDVSGFSWIGFPGTGETIVAAMQLISHCDALIFDMRQNHGGEVETLQLFRLMDGSLAYARQGSPATKLIPLADNRFLLPDWAKFEFCLDDQGIAASVTISYRDGRPSTTLTQ